jgi:hypothetical protein
VVKDNDLSYDNLKKVKFIDACIKETQRYFTFLMLMREADHDCEVAGVKVCKFLSFKHQKYHLEDRERKPADVLAFRSS